MKGQKVLSFYSRKFKLELLIFLTNGRSEGSNSYALPSQEDISRLRRKLETTKKPDNVPKCDEILMEEIKDYKVRKTASVICMCMCMCVCVC